jgi:hypothetical protein
MIRAVVQRIDITMTDSRIGTKATILPPKKTIANRMRNIIPTGIVSFC